MAGESPPRKRPCVQCGGPPESDRPDWDLWLGMRQLPAFVLLFPRDSQGAAEGVSIEVKALRTFAPQILQILQGGDAKLPLTLAVDLSAEELQYFAAFCRKGEEGDEPDFDKMTPVRRCLRGRHALCGDQAGRSDLLCYRKQQRAWQLFYTEWRPNQRHGKSCATSFTACLSRQPCASPDGLS